MPKKFARVGAKYSDLEEGIEENLPLDQVLRQLGKFTDEDIKENDKQRIAANSQLKSGLICSVFGFLVTIAPQTFSYPKQLS